MPTKNVKTKTYLLFLVILPALCLLYYPITGEEKPEPKVKGDEIEVKIAELDEQKKKIAESEQTMAADASD